MASEIPRAAEFPSQRSGIALLGIDGIVHLRHFPVRKFAAQDVQSAAHLRMLAKGGAPKDGHSLIRWKEVAVIVQYDHTKRDNESVGRTAGDNIHLMFLERPVEQTEIHDAGRGSKLQSVDARQARVAVGTLHEFVAKSGAPSCSVRDQVRDGAQLEARGIFTANDDREGIVESERRADFKTEAIPVGISNRPVDRVRIVGRGFAQYSREGRAGIFSVEVHLPGEHRSMAYKRAPQVEPTINSQTRVGFDLLRQQLGENDLFSK